MEKDASYEFCIKRELPFQKNKVDVQDDKELCLIDLNFGCVCFMVMHIFSVSRCIAPFHSL